MGNWLQESLQDWPIHPSWQASGKDMGAPSDDKLDQPKGAVEEGFIISFRHNHIVGSAENGQG